VIPVRHELHLTVRGLLALVPLTLLLATAGAFVAGGRGAASAALGAGLVAANQGMAALSTGWARTLTPSVAAVGYGTWVIRMFVMFGVFAALTQVAWLHDGLVAVAFCASLVTALAVECWGFAKGSYVPRWRMVTR
jgi:hypothetical protein